MSRTLASALLLGCCASLLSGCRALEPAREPAPRVRGPLPSRAHQPLALSFLALRPRRAQVLEDGALQLDARLVYASIEELGADDTTRVVFDGEVARGSLALRYGLGAATDVEVELGLLYTSGGFLDDFVEAWHDVFNLPNGGRGAVPDDRHEMSIQQGGETLYELDEGRLGVTDVPIVVTRRLAGEEPGDLFLAARLGVELPVGSEEDGFGNGELDVGGGLLAERSLGRWTLFGNVDYVLPGQPAAFEAADVELADRFTIGLGAELRWSDRTSLLVQATWISPLTRDLDLEEIDREIFDLGFGLARDVGGRSRWTASFHEDLVSATGSDFKVLLAWTWAR